DRVGVAAARRVSRRRARRLGGGSGGLETVGDFTLLQQARGAAAAAIHFARTATLVRPCHSRGQGLSTLSFAGGTTAGSNARAGLFHASRAEVPCDDSPQSH